MSYRAAVITCSDRASSDVYEDRSGPVIRHALKELGELAGACPAAENEQAVGPLVQLQQRVAGQGLDCVQTGDRR